ncbi:MAG: GxxExxY protein [Pseudomonadota bacterium]|nr:GxxExxY protein [Pseudomonadota bacterium]
MRDIDAISGEVLDLAWRLHRELGPGLLESVHETVIAGRLATMGYSVSRQHSVDIHFDEHVFPAAFADRRSAGRRDKVR